MLSYDYIIDGEDIAAAGEASAGMKQILKKLGVDSETIRRAAICMFEGEINMVLHANGGTAHVEISDRDITITLTDTGQGIEDIAKAMQTGYSTASQSARALGFGAGMGLPNMKKNSNEMTISSIPGTGTTVTMKILLPES